MTRHAISLESGVILLKNQLIEVITTEVLVRHHGTNGAIAKSNMASVGHIEKFIFFVSLHHMHLQYP